MTIPGLTTACSSDGVGVLTITRAETNLWWVTFGAPAVPAHMPASSQPPSTFVDALPLDAFPVTLAKVELDACGAWVTICNGEASRPVVVRRAGWVDLRGHPVSESLAPFTDDRVGLGPGDALVFFRSQLLPQRDENLDELLDALLERAGAKPARILAAALAVDEEASVAVIAVPPEVGDDPRQRLARDLGVDEGELLLPGYPVGDLQPGLWKEPPVPPRLARLRLSSDVASVRRVRELVDRLLASWRLDGRIDEDGLKLAASELATNAIVHTGEAETATVQYLGSTVRFEVDDRSATFPRARIDESEVEEGGRGLGLVEALTDTWGVAARPVGKRVWCEVAVRANDA